MTVSAVVFDWGRVLARGDRAYIQEVAQDYGMAQDEGVGVFYGAGGENSRAGQPFGVADLAQSMAAALSERLGEQALEMATRLCAVYHDPDRQATIPEMLALFADLQRANVPVAILSNGPREARGQMEAVLGAAMPRVLWLSGERGVGKPQRESFVGIAAELGVATSACVFIDDLAANASAARQAGMHALHFTGDVAAIRGGLQALGLRWAE